MTLDRAREFVETQVELGSGYSRSAVRLIVGERAREQGQGTVDALIWQLDPEQAFGLKPGTDFSGVGR